MNWEERREKLIKMYDNYCMNDFFKKIVTQEQSMIAQLEADNKELREVMMNCLKTFHAIGCTTEAEIVSEILRVLK
jgi:hypothetical protein